MYFIYISFNLHAKENSLEDASVQKTDQETHYMQAKAREANVVESKTALGNHSPRCADDPGMGRVSPISRTRLSETLQ